MSMQWDTVLLCQRLAVLLVIVVVVIEIIIILIITMGKYKTQKKHMEIGKASHTEKKWKNIHSYHEGKVLFSEKVFVLTLTACLCTYTISLR